MIGSIIKEIRLSKNIAPVAVYSGIMSRANYWKLEEEHIAPSFDSVILMLPRLNISLNEFILLIPDNDLSFYEKEKDKRDYHYKSKNCSKLFLLEQEYMEKYKQTKVLRFKHLSFTCNIFISKIKGQSFKNAYVNEIKKYLFNCENWSYYELRLFTSIMFIFKYTDVITLSKNALSSIQKYSAQFKSWNEEATLIVNLLSLAVQNNDLLAVKMIQNVVNKDIYLSNKSMYSRTLLLWSDKIIEAYLENNVDILDEAYKTISVFQIIGMDSTYQMYYAWTNLYKQKMKDSK